VYRFIRGGNRYRNAFPVPLSFTSFIEKPLNGRANRRMVEESIHIREVTSKALILVVVLREYRVEFRDFCLKLTDVREIKMLRSRVFENKVKSSSSSIKYTAIRVRRIRSNRSILKEIFILEKSIRFRYRYLMGSRVAVKPIPVLVTIV
jgi:hypothetical protein